MCHQIIWSYSLCNHPYPEASFSVPCQKALREGYECVQSRQIESSFPVPGKCLECNYKAHEERLDLMRRLRTRNRGRGPSRAALDAAFEIEEEEWYSDSEGMTESEIDLNMPPGCAGTRSSPADAAEKTDNRMVHHRGPARRARLVIPSTPIISHCAIVETEKEDDDDEEPAPRGISWRSWIPLPTRLLRTQSDLKEALTEKELAEKKVAAACKSAVWGAVTKGWNWQYLVPASSEK